MANLISPDLDYYTQIHKQITIHSIIQYDVFILTDKNDYDCYMKVLELDIELTKQCDFLTSLNSIVKTHKNTYTIQSIHNTFQSLKSQFYSRGKSEKDLIFVMIIDNSRYPPNGAYNWNPVQVEARLQHTFTQESWPKTCSIILIIVTVICIIIIIILTVVAIFQYRKIRQGQKDHNTSTTVKHGKMSSVTQDTDGLNHDLQYQMIQKSLHDS